MIQPNESIKMHGKTENLKQTKPRQLRNKCKSLLTIILSLKRTLSQGQKAECRMCIEQSQ